jgi:hypothetical protein
MAHVAAQILLPYKILGWTPGDLGSALRAWYKADILTGSNGDPQGAWSDSSGNGFDLSQTGTTRPTLAAADLNSLNTLRFTASSAQRFTTPRTILSAGSAGSAYMIQKVISAAVNNGNMSWGTSGSDNHWPFSDGNLYIDFGSTVRKSCGAPTGALTSYRIFSLYSAANDWALYVDGGTGGSGGGTSPLFSTGTNTVSWSGSNPHIGANNSLVGLDGWISEVLFTNAKQTTGDRQKVEGYLAWKWGLTGNLSASHPYKSVAP